MMIKILKISRPALFLPVLFTGILFYMGQAATAQESHDSKVSAAPVGEVTTSPMDIARTPVHEVTVDETTHPMLRLTPDKSEIIRLDTSVQSLIVGNPTHLNVLMDNARTLVLVPREPGATHFTALGKNGKVIMQRHVIVGSPAEKYVRIRRSCMNAGGGECQQTSVYYCPDMCHQVSIMGADQGQPETSASAGGPGTAALPPGMGSPGNTPRP